MIWILMAAVCVVLATVGWWASGRGRPRLRIDRAAALADAESAARSERIGLHPPSPGAGL